MKLINKTKGFDVVETWSGRKKGYKISVIKRIDGSWYYLIVKDDYTFNSLWDELKFKSKDECALSAEVKVDRLVKGNLHWKYPLDIFPGEWYGTYHEAELLRELSIGDKIKVIVDAQLNDELPRRIGQVGTVIGIDHRDEWSYNVDFGNGTNWFKRYILEKVD